MTWTRSDVYFLCVRLAPMSIILYLVWDENNMLDIGKTHNINYVITIEIHLRQNIINLKHNEFANLYGMLFIAGPPRAIVNFANCLDTFSTSGG